MAISKTDLEFAATRGKAIVEAASNLVNQAGGGDGAQSYLAAGKIHEMERVYGLAREFYEAASQDEKLRSEAMLRVALIHQKSGNGAHAMELALKVADQDPNFVFEDLTGRSRSVQTVLGDLYAASGQIDEAQTSYRQALKLVSDDERAGIQLADILIEQGDLDGASEIANTSLSGTAADAFAATADLLRNDPNRLPALQGVISDVARAHSVAV